MFTSISRREFLSLVPAAAVVARSTPRAHAQTEGRLPAQKFRIGHNVGPYLRVGEPVQGFWTAVEELSALGFKGTEADDGIPKLSATFANDTGPFRDRLAKHGIAMVALYHTLPANDASRMKESIGEGMRVGKFIKEIGASIFNLAGGSRRPEGNTPEDYRAVTSLANEMGKRLREEHGVRLGLHPHTGHTIERHEDIGRLMEMTDPRYLSLCPDTGHLAAGGSDPLEVFRTYRSRIIYMHYKDWDPEMVTPHTAATGRKGGFPELGEGIVDFRALTDFLLTTEYQDWVMIEIDSSRTTPLDSAKKNKDFIVRTLNLKVA